MACACCHQAGAHLYRSLPGSSPQASSCPTLLLVLAFVLQVMPSMRAMMTAGPALKKCNIAGYNCSYLPIDHPHAFDEVLYILMNGTGGS